LNHKNAQIQESAKETEERYRKSIEATELKAGRFADVIEKLKRKLRIEREQDCTT
jgi:hypothetical protein